MTWLTAKVAILRRSKIHILLNDRVVWCQNNLSSNGVLWKHSYDDPFNFYFAQKQDLVLFKLIFG